MLLAARGRCCYKDSVSYSMKIATSNIKDEIQATSRITKQAYLQNIGVTCNLIAQREHRYSYWMSGVLLTFHILDAAISAVRYDQVCVAKEIEGNQSPSVDASTGSFSFYPSTTSQLPF